MAGLRLFTGNRLETLSRVLADALKSPLTSPLEQEIFVVQSNGMERWVSMEIAKYLGISANNRFLFPNTFIHEMMSKVVPLEEGTSSGFSPDVMTWRIMKLLPVCLDEPAYEEIRYYLGNSLWNRKSYQLAAKIADIFDQYLLFRPEMIFRWENGEEGIWQADLWRKLASMDKKEGQIPHRAGLLKQFIEKLNTANPGKIDFPERISVFGISALPQFHMNVLEAISKISNVYLFLVNPCREYWGDILSLREVKKVSAKSGLRGKSRTLLYMEHANRILSDLGVLGRDFFDLIQEFDCEMEEFYEEPGESSLLSCIQSDILHLVNQSDKEGKKTISGDDHSVIVNSCHSPMREVEVLYDHLLHIFDKDPTLKPGDILVMTPDIENYAPYIQAVFDVPENDRKRIPYSIADRTVLNESIVIRAFNSLLDFSGSRFEVSRVLSFLEATPVREKFGFSKNDFALIEKWVKDTGIKWGIDAGHRGKMELPEFEENTWRAGLKQLLLGYAMKGGGEKVFQGILPYDGMEGENSIVMGRFVHFSEKLFDVVSLLDKPRTPAEWSFLLKLILEEFFLPEANTEKDFQAIRRTADGMKEVTEDAGITEMIGLDIVRQHLTNLFGKQGFGFGFLEGGVTFCAMVPMRSIPFQMICLIGMNSDAYPRQTRSPGFDLIAKNPKKGDRSRRNDDQYLFLESILSARQVLYVSYVGQSRIDNTPIPPAVPISSLIEYIDDNFKTPGDSARNHVVKTHRLQAFSQEYFSHTGELFSYSEEYQMVSEGMLKEGADVKPFIESSNVKDLESQDSLETLDLEDLVRFYSNPSEYYVKNRLGIYLNKQNEAVEGREAFRLDPLDRYFLEKELVEAVLAQRDPMDMMEAFRAGGRLPHGRTGEIVFTEMANTAMDFAEKVTSLSEGKTTEPVIINFSMAGFHLNGKVERSDTDRIVMYRNAGVKAKDMLRVWIYHLALNCMDKGAYPQISIFVGRNEKRNISVVEFSPVKNSYAALENILEYYRKGLESPIYFFPETSHCFAKHSIKEKKTPDVVNREAKKKWDGDKYSRGESENPYYELCFRGKNPLGKEFEKTSIDIFDPLLGSCNMN